jgi:hypothetical protein
MANLLDGLKETIVELLNPGARQERGELEALRQMYDPSNAAGGMPPNKWFRLYNPAGTCVGFSYVCACGQEWQMLSAFEWMRDYSCPQCKSKFDLLKSVGIRNDKGELASQDKWEALLCKLPVRPRLAGTAPAPRVLDTWANNSGDVTYGGDDARYRTKDYETNSDRWVGLMSGEPSSRR